MSSPQEWKSKYLDSLDQQERQEQNFKKLLALLVSAVVRISRLAEGQDPQMDKQLTGLRSLVKEDGFARKDLAIVVDALASQVKRQDAIKSERSKQLLASFQQLVKALEQLQPEKSVKTELKQFNKSLKTRTGSLPSYAALVKEYAELQNRALAERPDQQNRSGSVFSRWFNRGELKEAAISSDENTESSDTPPPPPLVVAGREQGDEALTAAEQPSQQNGSAPATPSPSSTAPLDIAAPLSSEQLSPATPAADANSTLEGNEYTANGAADSDEAEPPFSRFSEAICAILRELLQQIEPPPLAKENYQQALKQIEGGLNWYEMVAVLENISLVVVSALNVREQEFQQFLEQLNQRLAEADRLVGQSQTDQLASVEAGRELRETMREQVVAMQQSVQQTQDLQSLKQTVSSRLDHVLQAMDRHQESEHAREQSLTEQLDALVERVKKMEQESEQAEARIEEHRQRALRDVLTQLPNREAYQQRLEEEFERWRRYQRPLSLAVCDIDFFKRINDTYGHQAGDKVLRIIGKSVKQRLRKSDFLARYGGEEFVLLLPETTGEQAITVVDAIREAVANCPFHFKEKPVAITLSFGVCEFREGFNSEAVFAHADKALYRAKEQGRNQCVLAQ
jgi:diguanylate cyclase